MLGAIGKNGYSKKNYLTLLRQQAVGQEPATFTRTISLCRIKPTFRTVPVINCPYCKQHHVFSLNWLRQTTEQRDLVGDDSLDFIRQDKMTDAVRYNSLGQS